MAGPVAAGEAGLVGRARKRADADRAPVAQDPRPSERGVPVADAARSPARAHLEGVPVVLVARRRPRRSGDAGASDVTPQELAAVEAPADAPNVPRRSLERGQPGGGRGERRRRGQCQPHGGRAKPHWATLPQVRGAVDSRSSRARSFSVTVPPMSIRTSQRAGRPSAGAHQSVSRRVPGWAPPVTEWTSTTTVANGRPPTRTTS